MILRLRELKARTLLPAAEGVILNGALVTLPQAASATLLRQLLLVTVVVAVVVFVVFVVVVATCPVGILRCLE